MGDEHTKNDRAEHGRRRRPRRPPQERTREWYSDALVGPEGDTRPLTVARFYISTVNDEPPEIYFIPMPREYSAAHDGRVGLRSVYRGNIERNGIPLSMLDIDALHSALVTMKARLLREQQEYKEGGGGERRVRPRREAQPLTHRLAIPEKLVTVVPEPPRDAEKKETSSLSLAAAVVGW